ncbi:LacI family DNA-binding transcriptional regulator [Paraburkholderia caffeinilytica]|uniref:LacI family transcriptional regulator n=1 Tax=Paraburkholderia caffeinilytica TaxID=1761016 RepID=A0ABQ1NFP4_9BURK|nr:LacI family DNA-binding transcriptional regulator [Paraburkholderia caffeinilytica]GGC69839.1 LacI family transcriptional regulator [Paraburkholderia caffeinilytica]CAB3809050.1 HTH-type transcriptional repressor PurR [Paraburkholderia caffeinilytica]
MKSGPTIQDIAAEAGVSKSTVSLVLQESPRIKAETAEKVREAARKLGYVYNRGAATLRGRRSTTIGMVINDLTNPFFVELLVAIERVLAQSGYTTLMAHTAENLETQTRVLRSMREQNVAGLIMSPALGTSDDLPAEIQSWGIPLVLVMRPMGADVDTVGVDNEYGFALATEHLIEQGHTRIAFAGNRKGYAVANQRRQGYLSAMAKHSLSVNDDWIIDVELTPEGGRKAVRAIFEMKPRPTAVVCYNDQVAIGVLHELDRMGKRAGKALAVVGCDNVVAAEHTNPPLTTLFAGADKLGTIASETLLARLSETQEDEKPAVQYFAVPALVVRESSVGADATTSAATKKQALVAGER